LDFYCTPLTLTFPLYAFYFNLYPLSFNLWFFFLLLFVINILEPRHIPFVLKASALFIVIRSFFLILTHVGPPIGVLPLNPADLFFKLSSGDDLFFSSHTGFPLLMALIFWDEKYLRYFFILTTIAGAVVVLLGHLHYSIDVFAALFMRLSLSQTALILSKGQVCVVTVA